MAIQGCTTAGDDLCGLEGAIVGGTAGGSLAIPLAVHVANRSRGNLGIVMLSSAAVGAIGIATLYMSDNGLPILLTPIAQLLISVAMENRTAEERLPRNAGTHRPQGGSR